MGVYADSCTEDWKHDKGDKNRRHCQCLANWAKTAKSVYRTDRPDRKRLVAVGQTAGNRRCRLIPHRCRFADLVRSAIAICSTRCRTSTFQHLAIYQPQPYFQNKKWQRDETTSRIFTQHDTAKHG